jgi:CRISPR-associated protein Cmr4
LFDEDNWWKEKIGKNLVLLSDDDFRDFVNLSTEVITRTKINNLTGTVQDGALFTEEYLPAESVLYSLVLAAPVFPVLAKGEEDKRKRLSGKTHEESDAKAVITYFDKIISEEANNRLQIGANATIGKGLIRTTFLK